MGLGDNIHVYEKGSYLGRQWIRLPFPVSK